MNKDQAARFQQDPDNFLQEPLREAESEGPRRWEEPALGAALERAWQAWAERQMTAMRKEEAIRRAFAGHPAAGQFRLELGDTARSA